MTPTDQRALATWLTGLDDDALATVLSLRNIPPTAPWRDMFDAAAALLDPTSVDRTLTRLTRRSLAALLSPEGDDDLVRRALVHPDGRPYDIVAQRVEAARAAHPDAFAAQPEPEGVPSDATTDAVLAERAFTATTALGELTGAALSAPIARTGSGSISAADRRRLTEVGAVAPDGVAEDAIAIAESTGLLAAHEREWVPTRDASEWLERETLSRWADVVTGFRSALPEGIRSAEGGFSAPATWPDAYPLDPDWPTRAEALLRVARTWGLVSSDGAEPPWTRALREGSAPGTAELGVHLPAEIDRVYLQADLTAIAPGPLRAPLDLRLRRVAVRESHAQASTYRFSDESVTRAVASGETAESLRTFLGDLSLTGIPQPLEYLIERTASRHGLVRVSTEADRTRVTSPDAHLLDTIRVDQSLRAVGLIADADGLTSRATTDAVYFALLDARYPVVAIGGDGVPSRPTRSRPRGHRDRPADTTSYTALIETLRATAGTSVESAWLERELDRAVRNRAVIAVSVKLRDGTTRDFLLEATGIGGGRLRGRDRAADVERTVPIANIVSARPVD